MLRGVLQSANAVPTYVHNNGQTIFTAYARHDFLIVHLAPPKVTTVGQTWKREWSLSSGSFCWQRLFCWLVCIYLFLHYFVPEVKLNCSLRWMVKSSLDRLSLKTHLKFQNSSERLVRFYDPIDGHEKKRSRKVMLLKKTTAPDPLTQDEQPFCPQFCQYLCHSNGKHVVDRK